MGSITPHTGRLSALTRYFMAQASILSMLECIDRVSGSVPSAPLDQFALAVQASLYIISITVYCSIAHPVNKLINMLNVLLNLIIYTIIN